MSNQISINIFFLYFKAPCEDVKCGAHAYCKPNGQEAYCMCEEGWTYNPNDLSLGCVGKTLRLLIILHGCENINK